MTRLLIDDEVLMMLFRSMNDIKDTLGSAGGLARNDGKAAGDVQLAEQLVLFADDWRRTRNHMLEEIDAFQSMVEQVVEGFATADKQLADAITPDPAMTHADNVQAVNHQAAMTGQDPLAYANEHGIAGPGIAASETAAEQLARTGTVGGGTIAGTRG